MPTLIFDGLLLITSKNLKRLSSWPIFLLAFWALSCLPASSSDASLEISHPSRLVFRPGHWFYLPLELRSQDTGFQGLLSITLGENTFQQEVLISPPTKKIYYLPLFSQEPLNCSPLLLISSERKVAEREICFDPVFHEDWLILLVNQNPKSTDLSFRSQIVDERLHFIQVNPAELPPDWLALDSYDVLVIPNSLLSLLDDRRWETLKLWVMTGKLLLLWQENQTVPPHTRLVDLFSEAHFIKSSVSMLDQLDKHITIQKASIGLGQIIILSGEERQEQEEEVTLLSGLLKAGVLSHIIPPEPFSLAEEKNNVIKAFETTTADRFSRFTLPGLALGYFLAFILFWILAAFKFKRKPLFLFLSLLLFIWSVTLVIPRLHIVFTGFRSPVLARSFQFIHIFPDTGNALLKKFVFFHSWSRGKSPEVNFPTPGRFQTISLPGMSPPAWTLIWKENRPGFVMPAREWHFGQKMAFLWEGFLPLSQNLQLQWETVNGNITGFLSNRLPVSVHDLFLFWPDKGKLRYYEMINPGQQLRIGQGQEIESIFEMMLKHRPAWQKNALSRFLQNNKARTVLIGWMDSHFLSYSAPAIEGMTEIERRGNDQLIFIQEMR